MTSRLNDTTSNSNEQGRYKWQGRVPVQSIWKRGPGSKERNMKAVKDTAEEIQRPLALPFIAQSIETQI